ncbi:MAG: phosphoadenosine phosphosulfate reductase [Bacteroidetes bacterium GWF2_33_16]|nr:MAG: phosphoadenosine phosphosulfate reductase [Bacteroidetes bacterium GWE2_32_14]OFY04096.1 MAG: phosphoadenosine phosphosulfate reductase [Bacteroidetes bacterium GWF2_33_16]
MEKQVLAAKLNEQLKGFTPEKVLWYFIKEYGKNMAFSSSLGAEDQVLTNMICEIDKNTRIFTLDTGRMFPETYKLIEKTNSRYKIKIEIFFPDYQQVENMVHEKGINLFYESIDNRKQCCHIRKIEPLKRAFKGLDVWICGLRREQSITRTSNQLVEWDENNSLLKINPLIDWTENQVWDYIRKHNIPYNDLHDKGFPSIGCQPCTRAIKSGEDVRAGRWWWENPDKKECGLHNTAE